MEVVAAETEGVLGTVGTADGGRLTAVDGMVAHGTAIPGTAAGGPGTAVTEATISSAPSS